MTVRMRFLVFLALAFVGLTQRSTVDNWLQRITHVGSAAGGQPLMLSHTYVLSNGKWMDFRLPAAGEQVRVLATANCSRAALVGSTAQQDERAAVLYSLEYEYLDTADDVIDAGVFHFRAPLPELSPTDLLRSFYANDELLPAPSQSMRHRLSRLSDRPYLLRLRVAERTPQVKDISVRVYCREKTPDYKLAHAWRRTDHDARARLARGSVYGPDLLTDYERINLLRRKWMPLAPAGVEGRDYARRILYSRAGGNVLPTSEEEPPAGLPFGGYHLGVVSLPDGPARIRLEWEPVNENDVAYDAPVRVRWYGRRWDQTASWQLPAVGPRRWEINADGGLLELESTASYYVRAYWQPQGAGAGEEYTDITPQPDVVRSYQLGSAGKVEYALEHVAKRSTPFKIAVRRIVGLPADATPAATSSVRLDWRFLEEDGQTVREGSCELQLSASRYDRPTKPADPNHPATISDPAYRFFAVPAEVASVQFQSPDDNVVISAYTRPSGLRQITQVPDDYSAFHRQQGWRRSWFLIRPANYRQLDKELRAVTLIVQPRPGLTDKQEQRLRGAPFSWQSFEPAGRWTGRYALLPREYSPSGRWEIYGSAFREIPRGTDQHVRLLEDPGHRRTAPHLICMSAGEDPVQVRVFVEGRLHQELQIRGPLAETGLRPIEVPDDRPKKLRIDADGDTRLFLNRVETESGQTYFKRLIARFDGRCLTYRYDRREPTEELLAVNLFQSASDRPARLHVRISGPVQRSVEPQEDWTILERSYELRPVSAPLIPLYAAADAQIVEQQVCFVRLGSDLPPGEYTLEISREDESPAYLLLSKTSPGEVERRSVASELGDRAEE